MYTPSGVISDAMRSLFFDRPGTVDTKYSLYTTSAVTPSGSRLDFRKLPIAYRDFSQNARNGQKVPNGVPPEKTRFLTWARSLPHLGVRGVAQMRFSPHPPHQKVRKNALQPMSRSLYGVYTWLNLKIVFFFWGVPHFGALFGHFGHFG